MIVVSVWRLCVCIAVGVCVCLVSMSVCMCMCVCVCVYVYVGEVPGLSGVDDLALSLWPLCVCVCVCLCVSVCQVRERVLCRDLVSLLMSQKATLGTESTLRTTWRHNGAPGNSFLPQLSEILRTPFTS